MYTIKYYAYVVTAKNSSGEFLTEIIPCTGVHIQTFYLSKLKIQEAIDENAEKLKETNQNWRAVKNSSYILVNSSDLRIYPKFLDKLDYAKFLLMNSGFSVASCGGRKNRSTYETYTELYGKAHKYRLLIGWDEYWEDTYV